MRLSLFAVLLTGCSPATLTLTADKVTASANGTDAVSITVTPPSKSEVDFSVTSGGVLSATKATPGADGSAKVTLTSSMPAEVTVTATQGMLHASIIVTFTASTRLRFMTSPGTSGSQNLLRPIPVVVVEDNGAIVTSSSASIAVAVTPGSCSAQLDATSLATATAQQGSASFPGLKITTPASGCTLTATSGALTPAVSGSFDITP